MKNIIFIYLLLMSTFMVGQTISGKITTENGDEIPYANVYLKKTKIGTSSNNNGFYELNKQLLNQLLIHTWHLFDTGWWLLGYVDLFTRYDTKQSKI